MVGRTGSAVSDPSFPVRHAIGPDGKNHVGWASIPIHNLLDDTEIAALNTEFKEALGSLFPL